ncbi:hypothetical protein PENNAL_c0103G01398 [Penicillium nalgiovense]|uniref:Uncharacterized protein n=1 Tax=Penicillium nalgiovense TaxID=60175 RepID=A0A1V6X8X7_PENNA|nr:hypothetical protein PENNAL_c0103G01398 [Penicillium nalgiovense]
MKAGVDFASILLLLLAVLVVARPHDEPIHTATSTHPVRCPESASENETR